jgi:hypothetical protein
MPKVIAPNRVSNIDEGIFLQDTTSLFGGGLTGLVYNASGLTCYYVTSAGTTSVAVSLASMSAGTYTSGGFLEIDSTNMPGLYWFCPPDLAFIDGASSVTFYFRGAFNLVPRAVQYLISGPPVQAGKVSSFTSPGTTQFSASYQTYFPALVAYANAYNGMALLFTSGINRGLARRIVSSTFGSSNQTFTTAAFPNAPSAGDTFEILGA